MTHGWALSETANVAWDIVKIIYEGKILCITAIVSYTFYCVMKNSFQNVICILE